METRYVYERLDETGRIEFCPMNDPDGRITGHHVFGVKEWFDEHPEERKALGWIKHLEPTWKEQLGEDFDMTGMFLTKTLRQVDEYTVEDVWHAMPMSEEMMNFVEMSNTLGLTVSFGLLAEDGNGGVMYRV